MAPKTEHSLSPRAVRQLHRTRGFYLAGALLWAAITLWTGWSHPGSRQMWISLFLVVVFTGLLTATSWWLHRLQTAPSRRPAHHGAPRRAITSGRVHA
ncbi:hypothetical protein ACQPZG_32575 [Streptomyces sp. CA-294286]|uniref:hypothetical protein n=1 Tax=Streptomyces sp. CA-294286 TaxID=3240070 RepID=UPI003D90EF32